MYLISYLRRLSGVDLSNYEIPRLARSLLHTQRAAHTHGGLGLPQVDPGSLSSVHALLAGYALLC